MILKDVFYIRLKEMELQAERIMDPRLKTRSVAIISSSHSNGSVVSLSQEAKEEGLSIGMKVFLIKKMNLCVQLLPYNESLYRRINKYLYHTIACFTPVIEPINYQGFYLDMTGMQSIKGDAKNNALHIMNCIYQKTSMDSMVGISRNKLISHIVSSVVLDKIYKVKKGQEASFLSPLKPYVLPMAKHNPVRRIIKFLWINKIKGLQLISSHKDAFKTLFGIYSNQLLKQSHGQDSSLVKPLHLRDHILEHIILSEDTNNEDRLHAVVKKMSQQLAFKLRKRRQIANKIKLEIHYSDGYKSVKINKTKSNDDASIAQTCTQMIKQANFRRNRVRSILLDTSDFKPYLEQRSLFVDQNTINKRISRAVEKIRNKYGFDSLQTADIIQILNKS